MKLQYRIKLYSKVLPSTTYVLGVFRRQADTNSLLFSRCLQHLFRKDSFSKDTLQTVN